MNDKVFREYDIRGTYPTDINETMAYKIGLSYGSYIQKFYSQYKCIVSRDNRLSSESISTSLVNGLLKSGISVIDFGLTTTPMNFYARYKEKLFGIMVTASHNPKDDNGFKFSFGGPSNASGDDIKKFKEFTLKEEFISGQGFYERKDITDDYINYMTTGINLGKRKVKAIFDPGNAATTVILRKILQKFTIDFEIINEESDGNFPNHHPDPAETKNLLQLQKEVVKKRADIGIAFDGDGDRIGFVKNNGDFGTTEEFMILAIRGMFQNVNNKTFLYDVKCSKNIEEEIKKLGGTPLLYRTGASYTQEKVHTDNLPFGGEFSGHVFFRDKTHDVGSAIYAALRLIEVLSLTDKSIEKLTEDIPRYPITEEIKIPCNETLKFGIVEEIKKHCDIMKYPYNDIDGVKIFFKTGWTLVRASNTGPNLILRCEADTDEDKEKLRAYFMHYINLYNK